MEDAKRNPLSYVFTLIFYGMIVVILIFAIKEIANDTNPIPGGGGGDPVGDPIDNITGG